MEGPQLPNPTACYFLRHRPESESYACFTVGWLSLLVFTGRSIPPSVSCDVTPHPGHCTRAMSLVTTLVTRRVETVCSRGLLSLEVSDALTPPCSRLPPASGSEVVRLALCPVCRVCGFSSLQCLHPCAHHLWARHHPADVLLERFQSPSLQQPCRGHPCQCPLRTGG